MLNTTGKIRSGLRILAAALLMIPGAACGQDDTSAAADDGLVREPLNITQADGTTQHDFMVELALTPAQQSQGLMFREDMAADHGMLFVFSDVRPHSFWMKNTLIPLDIIFIRADATIAHIAERTIPLSETPIPSGEPVRSVLELNGGATERLGIKVGDRVSHPLIDAP